MKLDQNGLADSEMEVLTDIAPRHLEMQWIATGRGLEARWMVVQSLSSLSETTLATTAAGRLAA